MSKCCRRIKELINESGLNLCELAKESGISSRQYRRFINGTYPKFSDLIKLSSYFNCSVYYILSLSNF